MLGITILSRFQVLEKFALFEKMATESEGSYFGNDSSGRKPVKILIVGDYGIGKTTFINSYLGMVDVGIEELDLFEVYHLRIKHNGNAVDARLIDLFPCANSAERRKYYPTDVNAIILCFSIGHYKTLKSVYNLWIHEVRTHFGRLVPVFLVGLRSDLRLIIPRTFSYFPLLHHENDRPVEKCEAEIVHKKYYFHGDYMECSMYDVKSVIDVIQNAFLVAMED